MSIASLPSRPCIDPQHPLTKSDQYISQLHPESPESPESHLAGMSWHEGVAGARCPSPLVAPGAGHRSTYGGSHWTR